MATENESEQRNREKRSLETLVKEKRSELDRYTAQYVNYLLLYTAVVISHT